jgi:hypothetical protein
MAVVRESLSCAEVCANAALKTVCYVGFRDESLRSACRLQLSHSSAKHAAKRFDVIRKYQFPLGSWHVSTFPIKFQEDGMVPGQSGGQHTRKLISTLETQGVIIDGGVRLVKADIPSCSAHVRFWGKADMAYCSANVRL